MRGPSDLRAHVARRERVDRGLRTDRPADAAGATSTTLPDDEAPTRARRAPRLRTTGSSMDAMT
jgi:hypothetical protein